MIGWRAGRNPSSVRGDICLIGIPAPQTALTGAYYPFHNVGRRFTLVASLLGVSASLPSTGEGCLSVSSPGLSPDASQRHASVLWMEFPQAEARKSPTGSPTISSCQRPNTQEFPSQHPLTPSITGVGKAEHVQEALEFRSNVSTLFQLNTLSDWGQRAKHLDRSLDAYTPAPSTSSSMRALVRSWGSLPSPVERIGRLFSGEASGLDAFSPYPR